jgi:hypothetical protein
MLEALFQVTTFFEFKQIAQYVLFVSRIIILVVCNFDPLFRSLQRFEKLDSLGERLSNDSFLFDVVTGILNG